MSEEFDSLLRTAFPESTDKEVVRVIAEGIGLADDVRRNTPWLLNLVGDDLRGTLRRAATIFRIEQACREGRLPFQASEIENTNGTSHLLQIKAGRFEAHVVRTESAGAFPRDAPIRQDNRLKNQGDLFDEPKIVPLRQLSEDILAMYAWLTFDADKVGRLTHVCWCMPEQNRNVFLGRLNLMQTESGEVAIEPHEPTPPDPTSKMKFKDFLDRSVENQKKNKK